MLPPKWPFTVDPEKKSPNLESPKNTLQLTWVRPPCKQPPGVIGSFGWDEFNFPVDGVSRSDDGDWAAIVLEKNSQSHFISPWGTAVRTTTHLSALPSDCAHV